MWNPLQPERDMTGIDARTHISHPQARFDITDPKIQLAQVGLYHWSRNIDFIHKVAIGDLHPFLFHSFPEVTKRQMGMAVVQSTTYNPRKLKGVTSDNPHACMTYAIPNPLDLQYGLEWQMSMWIWAERYSPEKILHRSISPEQKHEMMVEIFDDLAALGEQELFLFMDGVRRQDFQFGTEEYLQPPSWPALWAKHGWTTEDYRPAPMERPRSLRRL